MKSLNTNRKGVTPIIAIILLLMMTVAIAGAAFFWFIRVQGELQGGTESYSESLSEKISAKVEVLAADYSSTNEVTIYFQNKGNILIPVSRSSTQPTTSWILQDSNQNIICSDDWSTSGSDTYCGTGCNNDLEIGEIQRVVLSLSGDCSISSNTTYPVNSLFYFTVDFSGMTGTGGSFIKD